MVQIIPRAQNFVDRLGGAPEDIGQSLGMMLSGNIQNDRRMDQQQQQKQALQQLGIDPNLPGEFQKLAYEYGEKSKIEKQKKISELQGNAKILRDLEQRRGLEEGSLNAYLSDPKAAEQVTRPQKDSKKTQASQPIDPEQLKIIKNVRSSSEYKEATPLEKYQLMTDSGISKENAQAEADIAAKQSDIQQKGFEGAYKANEDFINEATSSYKAFETEMKPRLLQMRNIPDDEIVGPTAAVFLEHLGIPLGALENPSSELYNKLSQDLLKGLPETYGSRILKVEVDNFLKTIPTLMNSPDGRRMIASNMLKLGEMKEVYYNEMRKQQTEALDKNKFPRDFQQKVFDQVKPQIDRINNEFVKLSDIKSVPKNTIPFFTPTGEVKFVPKEHAQWAQENGGRRIW